MSFRSALRWSFLVLLLTTGVRLAGADPATWVVARDGAFRRIDGGQSTPFFVHAVNLGVGVPGSQPGELAITRDQYDRWLARMRSMGFTAVRLYTLHFPRFYEALRDYNLAHPEAPLYLLQGVWLDEDNPTLDLHSLTADFDLNLREAVGAVHGDIFIDEPAVTGRYGRAYGLYPADVSPWLLGWIIGREVYPFEVATTDRLYPDQTAYAGELIALPAGSPTEAWVTERLDYLAVLERDTYGMGRPLSFSSWPTLDPLRHPTESRWSYEDTHSIDLANLDTTRFDPGYFASYHAYPYYPDFMSEDPAYTNVVDAAGPNSYLGYLRALRDHYDPVPLFIAEFGVPSSWGDAHVAHSGMDHGGHDEEAQGRYAVRMFSNQVEAGCAGGALFAWIDEWWKNSWITSQLDFPLDRRPLWLNVTAPEQNFGLIGFREEPPVWAAAPLTGDPGPVTAARWAAGHRFFELEIDTVPAAGPLVVGFDTYGDEVGESVLPGNLATAVRSEFALVLDGGAAQLWVTEAYDLFGIWHDLSGPRQRYRSVATDGASWMPVEWLSNPDHYSDDHTHLFPATVDEIGRLQVAADGDYVSSRDAVAVAPGRVRVRLPWTLLQFTDPSRRRVVDDDRLTPERETVVSEGVRLVIAQGGGLAVTERLVWAGWEVGPATTEQAKASMPILEEYLLGSAGTEEMWLRVVERTGAELTLDWDGGGVLQRAPTATGPWSSVGIGAPTVVPLAGNRSGFFRVKRGAGSP